MKIYNKYIVQYVLKNGIVSPERTLSYCQNIPGAPIQDIIQLRNAIITINQEISKQSFKIVTNHCEVTNRELLIWTNTKNDEISKLQLIFSPIELQYFHIIMEEIVNSENHQLTFPVVLNITSTLTSPLTRESGQKVYQTWVKLGYFVQENNYVYLGPRLIVEFTSYLKSKCPDQICKLCSELVFRGRSCSSCNKLLHVYCLDRYLASQNKCPCCRKLWVDKPDVSTQQLAYHDEDSDD